MQPNRWLASVVSAVALAVAALPAPTLAWIWPEHRDIAAEAVTGMPGAQKKVLEEMWASLRTEAPRQLCPLLVDPGGDPASTYPGWVGTPSQWSSACVDFPSYPALAGDHSCSSADLRAVTETKEWTPKVVFVAAQAKRKLAAAGDTPVRGDVWNGSHLALQYVDPDYLSRASGNNAHFLLPRASIEAVEPLEGYLARALDPSTPMNATSIYANYHALAMRLAAQWRVAPAEQKPDLARRALLAEGIALHFLEDSFSAGHYAATWGSSAWQKGTHDLYCVMGLTSMTWGGVIFASHGDAHMTHHDRKVAAVGVRKSLAQLADAASGAIAVPSTPLTPQEKAVEDTDFCKATTLPFQDLDKQSLTAALAVLRDTPVPSGDQESIHPPRARADIGPFVGVVAGITAGPAWGGYDTTSGWRFRDELEVGARVGYGLEGVLTTNMDGQIWAQASFVTDPPQLDVSCPGCPGGKRTNQAVPRVPARSALKLALRMPYYVIPFDLILIAPVLLLASPDALQDVVFASAAGGLWTLQRPISTDAGTLQFMAGREFGITFFGGGSGSQFFATPTSNAADWYVVEYKSIELDFPVLEYTPPRAFATTLSLAAQIQAGFSVELPYNAGTLVTTTNPVKTPYDMGTSWFAYLRLRLDARKYFGGSPEDWKN